MPVDSQCLNKELCVLTAQAMIRLHRCAGWPEVLLFMYCLKQPFSVS